jgi:2-amino-4-hydroxy-6-hydroxymethyldihydropteridine diphosphokinase
MHERAFVLVPLAEIAPAWRHPILGRTAAELRDDLPREKLEAIRTL